LRTAEGSRQYQEVESEAGSGPENYMTLKTTTLSGTTVAPGMRTLVALTALTGLLVGRPLGAQDATSQVPDPAAQFRLNDDATAYDTLREFRRVLDQYPTTQRSRGITATSAFAIFGNCESGHTSLNRTGASAGRRTSTSRSKWCCSVAP